MYSVKTSKDRFLDALRYSDQTVTTSAQIVLKFRRIMFYKLSKC